MATTPTPIGEQLYNNFENNILPSYRAANLVFAYYAAFPLVFSPDMLYQLWLNFQDYQDCQPNEAQITTLPMVVVSDLLQSGMCQEVAFELYELHEEVAAYLKNNIKQLLHAKNIQLLYNHKDIAAFTLGYANQYLQHPNRRNLFDIYYWKSLFEAYPEQASQEIKTAIEKPQIANSDTQNTLYLALAEQQAEASAHNTPQQEYGKLPIFSYQAAPDHIDITDKYLAQQIADRLGLKATKTNAKEINIFLYYNYNDRNLGNWFQKHLVSLHSTKAVNINHTSEAPKQRIDTYIQQANLVLLLVSQDFLLDEFSHYVIKQSLERYETDNSYTLIPVILKRCDWKNSDIASLLVLPSDGTPVMSFPNTDKIWVDIVNQINVFIEAYYRNGTWQRKSPTVSFAQQLITQSRAQNLKRLDLGNCGLTDLETQVPELFELEQLEELVLSNKWLSTDKQEWINSANAGQANKLSQLPQAMAQLKQLKVLVCGGVWLYNWEVSDLSFLQNLPQLTHLNLSFNQITKLENLDKLPNLQQLDVYGNQITKLENLDKLPSLQQLGIRSNEIMQLENLDKLPNLQQLDISANKIGKLENLDKLPNLQKLDISENQITKLENLDKLPNLQQLDISWNQITKLENLDKLPNLQQLDIRHNQITKLENLDKLPNLQQLGINHNQITKLENLDKLPNLQQLGISDNKITDLTPLLDHYKRGVKIEVANNPLTNPPMEIVGQGREAIVNYFEQSKPIKVFIAYSSADSDYLHTLKKHLAPLEKAKRVYVWYDGNLSPGDEWDAKIKHNLATADLILLLISADALISDYFYDKVMEKALRRHEQKEAIVIPIIVRPCLWEETLIHRLQVLPQDARPISSWQHRDEAYYSIVRGIRTAIENLLKIREVKAQLTTLKANILQLLEQNDLEQAEQALQKAYALNLPDPELDELQTVWQKLKVKLPPPIQQLINDMITVEGGSFMMGSNEYDNEKPIHQVSLSTFKIAKYQVTQAQWQAVMNDNPSHFKGEQNPVDSVNWDDTQKFIKKLNALYSPLRGEQSDIPPLSGGGRGGLFRLPTEAEWEYAARGGHKSSFNKGGQGGFTYAGSNNIDEVAWYDGNSGNKTHPVGQKKPNELGIYDMSGNVFEWCQDWYDNSYYKNSPTNSPTNNPTGPTSGTSRVLRGGSWRSYAQRCRSAYRDNFTPSIRDRNRGFRLVCVP